MFLYNEILKDFEKQKVKYIVVGGLAFNLLGGQRSTSDLDILVEMSDINLAKIVKILTKRGYHVKQPVDPMGIADKATRQNWIHHKNMKAFNFYKEDEFKEVDIIIETPVSFEMAKKTIRYIKIDTVTVPVISINHLIKMKEKANRDIDRTDIKELKILERLKKEQK